MPAPESWKKKTALFLVSQIVSIFGSTIVGFVIIWHVAQTTSSGRWMTLSILCTMLPQMLASLWGGVLADRFNRKRIAMAADAFVGVATLVLAVVFLLGRGNLRILLGVAMLRAVGSGLQGPAVSAIYPQIVPKEHLTKVNGIYHSIHASFMLFSPALAAVLLDRAGISWAFFVDVVTAVFAVGILAMIDVPSPEGSEDRMQRKPVIDGLRRGFAFTFGSRLLKPLVICYAVFFFLHTPVSFLTPIMIGRSFGGEAWRLSMNEIVWSVGSLLGGVAVSWRGEFRDKVRTIGLCVVAFGVCFALLGLVGNFWLYMLAMGVAGFFLPVHTTAQTVLVQECVGEEMMGRVFSVLQLIPSGVMPLGMLLFGPLGDLMQIEKILVVTGCLQMILGLVYVGYTKKIR